MASTAASTAASTSPDTSTATHVPRRTPVAGPMMAFERSLHSVPAHQAAAHDSAAPATSRVRLTRRGRLVVLLTLVVLLLVAFTLGRAGYSQAATHRPGQAPAPVSARAQTTVHEGESLWAVARRVAPGQDPRALVLRLRELNHLESGAVQAGQQLVLPS